MHPQTHERECGPVPEGAEPVCTVGNVTYPVTFDESIPVGDIRLLDIFAQKPDHTIVGVGWRTATPKKPWPKEFTEELIDEREMEE